ncbi:MULTISPECIES: hypothetical protein [unclassified Xanthobacter]|uniref:hypothetical protein n=1 Tax=unclassified Xanthobacter TaxID=2623496 RepID=UPI001EDFA7EA|nr:MULTISPECIES: hypothetical protein [unclassified Xanthobacter]
MPPAASLVAVRALLDALGQATDRFARARQRRLGSDGAARAPAAPTIIAGAALLIATTMASAQTAGPVTLPYLNAPAPGAPITAPPTLGISIGGAMHRAVMDTGSTGVIISASSIAHLDQLPDLGPGSLTYSSSGRIMRGRYVVAPVTVHGADGRRVTTRPLPVLAVSRIDCLKTARNCTPRDKPRGVAMLGIGFARERDHQPQGTPEKNPFLNLPNMAPGALRRGYVVSRQGVQVGLTGAEEGFTRISLARSDIPGEWAPLPACLSLAGRQPPACGTLLMDTGVTRMYLTVPESQSAGLLAGGGADARLAPGTPVQVVPPNGVAGPRYGFTAGDAADPLAPAEIVVSRRARRAPFINTTVRFLNGFDYLYDADAGVVGLRPLRP